MLTTVEGIYENGTIRLLEPLRGIARARVAVTVLPPARDEIPVAATPAALATFQPKSELGRRLFALRQQALSSGMTMLTQDEVLTEIRQRRGEDG